MKQKEGWLAASLRNAFLFVCCCLGWGGDCAVVYICFEVSFVFCLFLPHFVVRIL